MKRALPTTTITCMFLVASAHPATTYTIAEVGTLEDLTDTVPTPPTSTGLAINDAGVVGGSSAVSGGSMVISEDPYVVIAEPWTVHAVRWEAGVLTDLGVLGPDAPPNEFPRPSAYVNSMNNHRQSVGDAQVLADGVYHAFIELPEPAYGLPAGMTEIPALAVQARAWAINDSGVVVGETRAQPTDPSPVAAIWTVAGGAWTTQDLGTLGGIGSIAYGVNELGAVTGTFTTGLPENTSHAFLYLPEPAYGLPAGMTNLTEEFSGPGAIGRDVNDLGQVVGRGPGWSPMLWLPESAYGLPAGVNDFPNATLFDQETLDLYGFLGVAFAEFYAINNSGTAVGNATFAFELPNGSIAFTTRGFAWIDGEFALTQELLPPASGWDFLAFSWGVNDAGQIVGTGVLDGGESSRGYVLTPIGIAGDVDGDGDVDFADLIALLAAWGDCPAPPAGCPADFDGNEAVDFQDLLTLLSNWS